MIIGVISDTHHYLDPKVFSHFQNVDHIIHAGDIGDGNIITSLEKAAPVSAVKGNTDRFPLTHRHPLEHALELGGTCFFVRHIVSQPEYLDPGEWQYFRSLEADVVVFGHTHTPYAKTSNGILFFNPGSAGERRGAPRSVGIITIKEDHIHHEIISLE